MLGATALCPFAPGVPVVVHAPVCVIAMGPPFSQPVQPSAKKARQGTKSHFQP